MNLTPGFRLAALAASLAVTFLIVTALAEYGIPAHPEPLLAGPTAVAGTLR